MTQNGFILRSYRALAAFLFTVSLASCGLSSSSPPQSPTAYLNGALNWMQSHSVFQRRVNWMMMHHQALAMTRQATSTAAAYPAIEFAIKRLHDGFFLRPNQLKHPIDVGFRALYPQGLVVDIDPNGPAAWAGLRIGDVIIRINGSPPRSYADLPGLTAGKVVQYHLVLRRNGRPEPVTISYRVSPNLPLHQCSATPRGRRFQASRGTVGYIDLPSDCNTPTYATIGQGLLRTADRHGACGWIVDLRHTNFGDIWTYLATIGPILGQGKLGGFVYADGRHESWEYRAEKVYWKGQERDESYITGSVYRVRWPMAPVAVLLSRDTDAAGELALVALHGRPSTRSFGERTAGHPTLTVFTPLSDGAAIAVSGAFSFDRTGRAFKGPIVPDTKTRTDWTHFGTEHDPTVRAALRWLQQQPGCPPS
jgi:carboxyl-terminal processing protease